MTRQKRSSPYVAALVLSVLAVILTPFAGFVGTAYAAGETFTWDPGQANAQYSNSKLVIAGGNTLPGTLTLNFVVQGTYRTVFTSQTGCQITAQMEMAVPPRDGDRGTLTFSRPPDCTDVGFRASDVGPPIIKVVTVAPPEGIACRPGNSWDGKYCTYPMPSTGCQPGDAVLQGTATCREGGLEAKEPHCAVVGLGMIPCPINIGPGTEDCFVRDPGAPGGGPLWVKHDCTGPVYLKAAATPTNLNCGGGGTGAQCDPALQCATNCDVVAKYVNPAIQTVAALVGLAVTASIIWAGLQYASSAHNPQAVTKAKNRIRNAVLTLFGFFLLYAFLNWVIPGGI